MNIELYIDLSPNCRKRYVLVWQNYSKNPRVVYEVYHFYKKIDLIESILKNFAQRCENFYDKLYEIDTIRFNRNPSRYNRYFANERKELPDDFARSLDDYWFNGNTGGGPKEGGTVNFLKEACEAAGIKFSGFITRGQHNINIIRYS